MTPWKTASALVALILVSPMALASPGRGGPGGRPGDRIGKTHTFGPGRKPGVDRKDFRKHLAPKEAISLYYAAAEVDEPGTIDMAVTMKNPAVVLEDVEAITGVVCSADSTSLTVTFANPLAFTTALEDWDTGSPVVLITNEDNGCSPDLERAYFVAESLKWDTTELTITVQAHQEVLKNIASEMSMDFTSLPAATLTRRIEFDPSTALSFSKALPRTQLFKNTYLDVAAESAQFSTTLTFSGHLNFSFLTFKLKELYFDVAAVFDSSAVVSAKLLASYTKTIKYEPAALSWSVVDVPGIVELGPGIQFGLQLDFEASAKAGITAGVGFAIPAGHVHIDIRNSSQSYVSGWSPKWTAYANLTQSAVVGVDVAANLKVEMAFDLLDGTVDLSSGITASPGITNTFTLRGDQSISPNGLLLPTSAYCSTSSNGVQLISDFVFKIQAYASTYWSKTLYSYQRRIFNKCYNFKL